MNLTFCYSLLHIKDCRLSQKMGTEKRSTGLQNGKQDEWLKKDCMDRKNKCSAAIRQCGEAKPNERYISTAEIIPRS